MGGPLVGFGRRVKGWADMRSGTHPTHQMQIPAESAKASERMAESSSARVWSRPEGLESQRSYLFCAEDGRKDRRGFNMRYTKFEIRNFKGIKDACVELDDASGASVYAMVGLNESGKTTLLQAIHSFSPEFTTDEISGEEKLLVPKDEPVPRHLISEFTDTLSISWMRSPSR